MTRWKPAPLVLVIASAAITLLTGLLCNQLSGAALAGVCLGGVLPLASIPFLRTNENEEAAALDAEKKAFATTQQQFDQDRAEFEQQQAGIEDWRDSVRTELDQQISRIEARERSLAQQFAVHQELFEYPNPKPDVVPIQQNQELSEQDRRVLDILQKEAETAYEKIREKGYSKDGGADIAAIREDVLKLITRVAQVYSPDSENPLLETSFEQVARAAGRVCLHTLVVVEQLPLDVKQYNFNSMYSYIQKAVDAYGRYQKTAPWMTYLSRSVYAGRFLAGANPLTLGAWVLATEVGKRAGQKAIESFVDRQAIGLLHDLIRVVGFEVANVFGGDFRHRDPNWIYGTELTELMGRFPVSRESLHEGLQQVSALPLRNEYDRIYLYRCIADHRAAGLTLADPAQLTREEREQIAARLEKFFADFVHGSREKDVDAWRTEFEDRFDMKLKLNDHTNTTPPDRTIDCAQSVSAFLQAVVGLNVDEATHQLRSTKLFEKLTQSDQSKVTSYHAESFEPPDLDPSDPAIDEYLDALTQATIAGIPPDENIERLLLETGAYFRRPAVELEKKINDQLIHRATRAFDEAAPKMSVPQELARIILASEGTARFAYTDLSYNTKDGTTKLPDAWLVGFDQTPILRAYTPSSAEPIWTATQVHADRDKGFLIDDCQLSDGAWANSAIPSNAVLIAAGSIRGGGYQRFFKALLDESASAPEEPPTRQE